MDSTFNNNINPKEDIRNSIKRKKKRSSSCTEIPDTILLDKKFICDYCQQRFRRKYSLNEHIKTHTGIRPYLCNSIFCNKTFTTSGNLARHKKIKHSKENFCKCLLSNCLNTFISINKRDHHMKEHYGQKPFNCFIKECHKRYATTGGLERHILNKHKIEKEKEKEKVNENEMIDFTKSATTNIHNKNKTELFSKDNTKKLNNNIPLIDINDKELSYLNNNNNNNNNMIQCPHHLRSHTKNEILKENNKKCIIYNNKMNNIQDFIHILDHKKQILCSEKSKNNKILNSKLYSSTLETKCYQEKEIEKEENKVKESKECKYNEGKKCSIGIRKRKYSANFEEIKRNISNIKEVSSIDLNKNINKICKDNDGMIDSLFNSPLSSYFNEWPGSTMEETEINEFQDNLLFDFPDFLRIPSYEELMIAKKNRVNNNNNNNVNDPKSNDLNDFDLFDLDLKELDIKDDLLINNRNDSNLNHSKIHSLEYNKKYNNISNNKIKINNNEISFDSQLNQILNDNNYDMSFLMENDLFLKTDLIENDSNDNDIKLLNQIKNNYENKELKENNKMYNKNPIIHHTRVA